MAIKHLDPDKIILVNALKFAVEKHGIQADKSGDPYIFHPLSVMLNKGLVTNEERIVGVLHDVLEDTKTLKAELEVVFSPAVVEAVSVLTRGGNETYRQYLERVKKNPLAVKVKLADLAHNLEYNRINKLSPQERDGLSRRYKEALDFLLAE